MLAAEISGTALLGTAFFGLGALAVVGFILFGLALTVFWVWMLIEVLTKEPSEGNDKLVWAIVLLLVGHIGAFLYFFVRRPERISRYGE